MGNQCCSGILTATVAPPSEGIILTNTEIADIIQTKFKMDRSKIFIGDKNYLAYPLETLKKFLEKDLADKIKYRSEVLDCDDFARILQGREREWFGRTQIENCGGSTFGCVWGDLRPTEESINPSYHAMNFFIDSDKNLWMVEPQTDKIREVTSKSSHWFAEV